MSVGTLSQYIQLVERMYRTAQGKSLAKLFSLRDEHVANGSLLSSDIVVLVEGNCVAPLDEIVIEHLLCVKVSVLSIIHYVVNIHCIGISILITMKWLLFAIRLNSTIYLLLQTLLCFVIITDS